MARQIASCEALDGHPRAAKQTVVWKRTSLGDNHRHQKPWSSMLKLKKVIDTMVWTGHQSMLLHALRSCPSLAQHVRV